MRKLLLRLVPVLAAGTLIVALVLLAVTVIEEGSAEVASEGQVAIQAEATLSAASGVRNGTQQAILLAQGVEFDVVKPLSLESALADLEATVAVFAARSSILEARLPIEAAPSLAELSGTFVNATEQVIGQLRTGATALAVRSRDGDGADAYEGLVTAVAQIRDDRISGVLVPAESVGRFADAVRFLVVFVIPVGAMFGFRRATRRRREREELEAQLAKQLEIETARDEFIANLSHELRTPLTGIYGFALTLDESGFSDQETAKELIGLIVSEASELSRMVDDLIAAGRLEAQHMFYEIEDVDLEAELDQVLEPFRRRGVKIGVSGDTTLVRADRLKLRQIIRNLVSNANTHGGEHIEIETWTDGSQVLIQVIDDGPGVPAQVQHRLFDRYIHEGTAPLLSGSVGLGLSIARSLAAGMGGTLKYQREDTYTRFEVRLPTVNSDTSTELVAVTGASISAANTPPK